MIPTALTNASLDLTSFIANRSAYHTINLAGIVIVVKTVFVRNGVPSHIHMVITVYVNQTDIA